MPIKYGKYAKYIHKRLAPPSQFKKGSFRTIPTGTHGAKVIIGKRKGESSTSAQALLIPKKNPSQLALGIREEGEHRDIYNAMRRAKGQIPYERFKTMIAKRHLKEDRHYYTKLKKAMNPTHTVTLIPYEYQGGMGMVMPVGDILWVDKRKPSPDPAGLMLWGFDSEGNTVEGDYKKSFKRAGKPVSFTYNDDTVTETYIKDGQEYTRYKVVSPLEARHNAIVTFLKSMRIKNPYPQVFAKLSKKDYFGHKEMLKRNITDHVAIGQKARAYAMLMRKMIALKNPSGKISKLDPEVKTIEIVRRKGKVMLVGRDKRYFPKHEQLLGVFKSSKQAVKHMGKYLYNNPAVTSAIKKGISTHKKWHNRSDIKQVQKVKPFALPIEKSNGKLVLVELGKTDEITYMSDKYDGKNRLWVHKFKKQPRLFTNTKGTVLIIAPVSLNRRGIVS